jgi:hypothetical protein
MAPLNGAPRIFWAIGKAKDLIYRRACIPRLQWSVTMKFQPSCTTIRLYRIERDIHMRGAEHWSVFTIGTGLGNARFTNRKAIQE